MWSNCRGIGAPSQADPPHISQRCPRSRIKMRRLVASVPARSRVALYRAWGQHIGQKVLLRGTGVPHVLQDPFSIGPRWPLLWLAAHELLQKDLRRSSYVRGLLQKRQTFGERLYASNAMTWRCPAQPRVVLLFEVAIPK